MQRRANIYGHPFIIVLNYRIIWTILDLLKRKARFIIFLEYKLPAKFLMNREYKVPSTEWEITWEQRLKKKITWHNYFKPIQVSKLWCGLGILYAFLIYILFIFISLIFNTVLVEYKYMCINMWIMNKCMNT